MGHVIKREWRERASSTARNLFGSGQASFGGWASSAFQHSAKAIHMWRTRVFLGSEPGCLRHLPLVVLGPSSILCLREEARLGQDK